MFKNDCEHGVGSVRKKGGVLRGWGMLQWAILVRGKAAGYAK